MSTPLAGLYTTDMGGGGLTAGQGGGGVGHRTDRAGRIPVDVLYKGEEGP
jgi:hypothetical protein